ncbi:ComEC/Rec2 family competence protein [Patescibacteria group bacterium]|nr:ComEC/Rec2 family competence protein [Patescibacteria group bacterium]
MINKLLSWNYLPLVLAVILYLLIFFVRYQQGGWEVNLDLFPKIRASLDHRISEVLPSPQAELLSGILLGNKKDLPGEFKLALRDSSTLHIVVVSGQNLTLLAALVLRLSGFLRRKTAILLSFAAILFYTMLTGAQIPVLRAAVMAMLVFGAEAFGRQRSGIWILIVTGGIMLLVNPKWITELSFQLSFLATLGVIAVAPALERALSFLPGFIKQDLAVTTGAQIMVMPIIIQNFHQLSLIGVLTNLLVGWTVPFIMILGSLALILGSALSLMVNILLTYFIYVVELSASLPFAWEYVGEQVWVVWVGYYLVLFGVLLGISKTQEKF